MRAITCDNGVTAAIILFLRGVLIDRTFLFIPYVKAGFAATAVRISNLT